MPLQRWTRSGTLNVDEKVFRVCSDFLQDSPKQKGLWNLRIETRNESNNFIVQHKRREVSRIEEQVSRFECQVGG